MNSQGKVRVIDTLILHSNGDCKRMRLSKETFKLTAQHCIQQGSLIVGSRKGWESILSE